MWPLSSSVEPQLILPKRFFGSTGIEVSVIGLGTVKLGRDQGVKYPQGFKIPNDQEASSLITLAKEMGVNLIDTAPAYGNSEERLGTLLNGQRQDWVICSKVGEEYENGTSSFNFTPEHTKLSVERSLKRLNTDFIDIVLIHSDGDDERIILKDGTLDALADLKQQGKIRAFGMSTKTVKGGLLAAEKSDGVMVTYNLAHRAELPIIDYCLEHHKGVFIKKALASGHVSLADGIDPVKASFDLILGHKGVSSAIVGTINPQHLKSNIAETSHILNLIE